MISLVSQIVNGEYGRNPRKRIFLQDGGHGSMPIMSMENIHIQNFAQMENCVRINRKPKMFIAVSIDAFQIPEQRRIEKVKMKVSQFSFPKAGISQNIQNSVGFAGKGIH